MGNFLCFNPKSIDEKRYSQNELAELLVSNFLVVISTKVIITKARLFLNTGQWF